MGYLFPLSPENENGSIPGFLGSKSGSEHRCIFSNDFLFMKKITPNTLCVSFMTRNTIFNHFV